MLRKLKDKRKGGGKRIVDNDIERQFHKANSFFQEELKRGYQHLIRVCYVILSELIHNVITGCGDTLDDVRRKRNEYENKNDVFFNNNNNDDYPDPPHHGILNRHAEVPPMIPSQVTTSNIGTGQGQSGGQPVQPLPLAPTTIPLPLAPTTLPLPIAPTTIPNSTVPQGGRSVERMAVLGGAKRKTRPEQQALTI